MVIFGLTIAEMATILGMVSLVVAWLRNSFVAIRTQITAPLIVALDKLRIEIGQLEHQLKADYQELAYEVAIIKEKTGKVREESERG